MAQMRIPMVTMATITRFTVAPLAHIQVLSLLFRLRYSHHEPLLCLAIGKMD